MPLIRRPWEFQPPGATLLDPENTLAQGIVAGTLGSSPVYIGGTASIGVSNTSFPPVATSAGIGFRAVALQQIARSITTTSDITLLIVGEVTSSSGTQSTFGGFSHNGTSDTFVIANGNGTTAGAITGRVYLGAYRTIGGSKTVPVGSTVVAVLRHRHNGAQELWVNGEKDASAGAFTGATVGNQFWGHYSATSTWAPCALGLGWNRALSDSEIASLSDNPWQVFEPERIWVPFTAATGGSFSSTGALSAQAATVAGSAAHLTLHTTTGALAAQAATVSGAAVSPHLSTGALEAQAATVAGTAARLVLHGSTGALSADAATVAGSASRAAGGSFDGVGVLTAQAAAIAGSAARLALHTATGSLVADAATVAGTAVHLTLHTSAGVLVAQEATVDGVAFIGDEPPAPSGIDIEYEFEPALWWQRKPKTLGNVKAKAKLAKVAKVIAKKAVEQVEKSAPEAQRKAEVRQAVAPMLPEMPGFDWKPVYEQAYSMALTAAIDAQMRQAEANQAAAREIERIRQLDEEDIAILVAMM